MKIFKKRVIILPRQLLFLEVHYLLLILIIRRNNGYVLQMKKIKIMKKCEMLWRFKIGVETLFDIEQIRIIIFLLRLQIWSASCNQYQTFFSRVLTKILIVVDLNTHYDVYCYILLLWTQINIWNLWKWSCFRAQDIK